LLDVISAIHYHTRLFLPGTNKWRRLLGCGDVLITDDASRAILHLRDLFKGETCHSCVFRGYVVQFLMIQKYTTRAASALPSHKLSILCSVAAVFFRLLAAVWLAVLREAFFKIQGAL
jgi:hypothetical protein